MTMNDEPVLNAFMRFYVETMGEFNKVEKPIFSLNYEGANNLVEIIFSANNKLIAHLNEINNTQPKLKISDDNE